MLDMFPYGRDGRSRIAGRPGTGGGSVTVRGAGNTTVFQQVSSYSAGTLSTVMYAVGGTAGAGAGKGHLYYVNSNTPKEDNASLAATAGVVPTTYAGAAVHRNRLWLYGGDHKFAASRVDAYGDWDFAAKDSARPFQSSDIVNVTSGAAADPIITAISWSNDLLVLAGDHSLAGIRGDPAMGGRIDVLSNGIGILGPSAWSIDPENQLWMVGTGGIYKGVGGVFSPLNIGHYSAYFQSINRNTNITSCAWDRDRYGLWIFSKNKNSLFYDARDQSFWPTTLGNSANAAGIFDGPAAADRQILFASGASVSSINSAALSDGGGQIAGYLWLGPIIPNPANPGDNWILGETDLTLGNIPAGFLAADLKLDWTLQAGNSPYAAYAAPTETAGGTISSAANRLPLIRSRLRGACFMLKLAMAGGSTFFEFESARFSFSPAGRAKI